MACVRCLPLLSLVSAQLYGYRISLGSKKHFIVGEGHGQGCCEINL